MTSLAVLAVDDEPPALDELAYLLAGCEAVGSVAGAGTAADALRRLQEQQFDVVLLDVQMPGLDGLSLAKVLGRFAEPPHVVFVTAHEEHALAAWDIGAAGYLLKPVDRERLERVLLRVLTERSDGDVDDLAVVAVEGARTTRLVARDEVQWVEAAGDYVRLHLRDGSGHLVRAAMATLEQRWAAHGFARVHRGALVSLRDVRELRTEAGGATVVVVGGTAVPVSRRHLRELRDRLVRPVRR